MHSDAATRAWAWYSLPLVLALPLLWRMIAGPPRQAYLLLAALALLAGLALILLRPESGALALVVIIYWNASDVITAQTGFSWLLTALLLWVTAAWLLHAGLTHKGPSLRWPLLVPVLTWGAAQCISGWLGSNQPDAIASLESYAKSVIILYLIVNLLRTPRRLHAAIQALLVAVLLMAAPVIVQGLTGSQFDFFGFAPREFAEIAPGQFGWRLGGSFDDPNFLAMMLVAALPVAAMEFFEPQPLAHRVLGAAAGAAALLAASFTYSRASLLGVAFVVTAFAWNHPRKKTIFAVFLALLAALVLAMPPTFRARLLSLRELSLTAPQQTIPDASFRGRRSELLTGLLMWRSHPVWGVGTGGYADAYESYSAWLGLDPREEMREPHNLYVQMAAETGIVGLLAFLYFIASGLIELRRARRALARRGLARSARAALGVELGLATYLLLSLFLHGAYFRNYILLLAIAAGFISVAQAWLASERDPLPNESAAGALPQPADPSPLHA